MSRLSICTGYSLTIVQDPCPLGDNERAPTADETWRPHRHHELCCYCFALVQPLLLCESHVNDLTYLIHTDDCSSALKSRATRTPAACSSLVLE